MSVVSVFAVVLVLVVLAHEIYEVGIMDGRREVLKDTVPDYIKQILFERDRLQKLQESLQNDCGIVSEWDD